MEDRKTLTYVGDIDVGRIADIRKNLTNTNNQLTKIIAFLRIKKAHFLGHFAHNIRHLKQF